MAYKIIESCTGCGACVRLCPVQAIAGEKKALHIIDPALCIECGACGRICPQASVLDTSGATCKSSKLSKWPKPVIDNALCMSCTICLDTCPVGCLGQQLTGEKGDLHSRPFLKDKKACIGCGFCALECPVNAIAMSVPAKASSASVNADDSR
jgi:electron transport complex protein RnfB